MLLRELWSAGGADPGGSKVVEVMALLAEVLEVGVEGGDDFFKGGEAGIAAGGGLFEGACMSEGLLALLAGFAELLPEAVDLGGGGEECPDEGSGGEGGGGFGVGGDGLEVDFEEVGLFGAELFEAGLEALDIFAELAEEAFGAGIGAGGLAFEGLGEGEGVGQLGEFLPSPGGLVRVGKGDGPGGRGGWFLAVASGFAEGKAHGGTRVLPGSS